MRAAVYDKYGPPDVLRIEDVPRPEPKAGEVRVRVRAVAVTRGDCATREANRKGGPVVSFLSRAIFGLRGPRQRILGTEFSGTVESVGAGATEFKPGDEVFGSTGFKFGAYAEYLVVPASARIARKPDNLTLEQAAAVTDGGLYALVPLRAANVKPGERVLVYGASGAIGTAGVQLAKHYGAIVTGVTETRNLDLVASLGADLVLDYTKEDFTKSGERYDVIFDAVGKLQFAQARGSLEAQGRFLPTDGLGNFLRALTSKNVVFEIPPRLSKQDVIFLKDLVEAGEFKPVADRVYPLEQVVEAHRYVDTERKVGNVVLTT
jgi:NADPH:quinone reductase-like Zn-dependent oxidoreductase